MAAKKQAKKATKKDLSAQQKVGIGVGLTTAAVAAAGAYFLYGSKNASKNRRTVKSWMFKAKAEVLEALEKAQEMTEEEFNDLVETVSKTYGQLKDASKADIAEFKKEMKENWPKIAKEGKQAVKKVKKAVAKPKKTAKKATKTAKKTVKKTAKKATKKKA